MGVVIVCVALLVAALVAGFRWRNEPFQPPPVIDRPGPGEVARRFVWYCSLVPVAAIPAGLAVIGAGGRLAMRLLAVTAGDDAQGLITEADEVVGEITVGGTIGFVVFNGIFGGLFTGVLYLLFRRMLPARWLGGLAFGVALLVVLGTTIDPLREENVDFDLVGPGWLAVVVFTALGLAYGVVLAAFVSRASAWLPLPAANLRILRRYVGPAAIAAVAFSITFILGAVCLLVIAVTRWPPVGRAVRSRPFVVVGRALLVAALVVSLPGALASFVDIAGR